MLLENTRILIISPHPDDEAICSGGLIMLAKKQKAHVYVLYMATGDSRQFQNGRTTESERIAEAKNAAKYGGFGHYIAFNKKSTLVDTLPQKELIEVIEDHVKVFKPDIVVIPNRNSYSQDHRAVATACISAFRPIPEVLHPQPQIILEMEEPVSYPVGFTPNFYVDISEVIHNKLTLYEMHQSQVTEDPQYRSPNNLLRLAGFRGSEIGVRYAEAYNLIKGQL